MNKKSSEIVSLRRDIEHNVKRRIRTPHDFEFLSGVVWERLHENISPTTLKRLWGYIEGADTTRRSTLCLLSRFLGYDDWEAYLQHLSEVSDTESDIFTTSGIRAEDLYVGEVVEVECDLFEVFNIRYIAIEKFDFAHTAGRQNQQFSINAYSDDDFSLLVK